VGPAIRIRCLRRIGDGAREGVSGGASWERHDHGGGAVRPLLRDGAVTRRKTKCKAEQAESEQARVSSELRAVLRWHQRLFSGKFVEALAVQPFGQFVGNGFVVEIGKGDV